MSDPTGNIQMQSPSVAGSAGLGVLIEARRLRDAVLGEGRVIIDYFKGDVVTMKALIHAMDHLNVRVLAWAVTTPYKVSSASL